MKIPPEAIAAATAALEDGLGYGFQDEDLIRRVLEAAAPRMLADSWESAYAIGYADRNVGVAPRRTNPYSLAPGH